jgi:hypothetical protein
VRETGNPFLVVDLPPDPWFVKGPRGGLYVATGSRERFASEDGDAFIRNVVVVVDKSEGVRYVRPGSRLYREWEATR